MVLGVVMAGLAAYQLAHVLMLVFASVLVAVLLTALADGVERVTRLPRAAAMAVAVLALLAGMVGFGVLFAQQLYRQLADVVSLVRSEIVEGHLASGVRMMDPSSVWIGPKVSIGEDVSVDPFVQIWGETSIKRGCRIGGFSILRDMDLEEDVQVVSHAVLSGSILQKSSKAGPFIVIRDGACLEEGAQGGKFVEIKKSVLGKGSKAPHLSYLGDAVIGEGTNIGAGTITCNYDGEKKNPTVIGNRCFVGSDTMFVAPVTLGDEASTGAGSVITQNVPEGALAVGRARQRNIEGWAQRKRKSANEGGDRN